METRQDVLWKQSNVYNLLIAICVHIFASSTAGYVDGLECIPVLADIGWVVRLLVITVLSRTYPANILHPMFPIPYVQDLGEGALFSVNVTFS